MNFVFEGPLRGWERRGGSGGKGRREDNCKKKWKVREGNESSTSCC